MRKIFELATITFLVVETTACLNSDIRPTQYADLRKRGTFDMRCEEQALKITPIKENDSPGFQYAEVAGVTCNDRRATYLWVNGTWVMNTDATRENAH